MTGSSLIDRFGTARLMTALTLVALVLRLYGIWSQPPTSDDFGVGISAINYMMDGQLGPTMWNHPALRSILAAGMLKLFGPGRFGTLALNVVLGTLCTPLVYAVCRRLTGSFVAALVAALLWSLEPIAIDYSRQAINDIYLAFFPLAGILAAYRYLESYRPGWLLAAGGLFGLGLASKWSALFQLAVVGLLVLSRSFREGRGLVLAARCCFVVASLIVLPATIYLASFAPWFSRGYSLAEWPALQKSMYRETKYHTGYKKEIYGDHRAWEWFIRPGVSHEDLIFVLPEGPLTAEPSLRENLTVLEGVANPLVWLAVIPAFFLVLRRWRRERPEGLAVLAALLFCSYAPLAFAGRPVWFNSALIVLPYVTMVVAYVLAEILPERGERWRRGAAWHVGAACAVSLLLYPLAIGKGTKLPLVGDYLLTKIRNTQGTSKENYTRDE